MKNINTYSLTVKIITAVAICVVGIAVNLAVKQQLNVTTVLALVS